MCIAILSEEFIQSQPGTKTIPEPSDPVPMPTPVPVVPSEPPIPIVIQPVQAQPPAPPISAVAVGSLNKAILKKWLIWLASRKTIRRKKDGTLLEGTILSGRRANSVIQSMRVAIRWAVDNEEILVDPFRRLGEVAEIMREKGVLNLAERNELIATPVIDYRQRLAVLLGCLCSMRRGEIRRLQWGDIEGSLIHIRHNYQDKGGMKLPKYGSVRSHGEILPYPTGHRL
jgi:integrase